MTDQIARPENAEPENAGLENDWLELTDQNNVRLCHWCRSICTLNTFRFFFM